MTGAVTSPLAESTPQLLIEVIYLIYSRRVKNFIWPSCRGGIVGVHKDFSLSFCDILSLEGSKVRRLHTRTFFMKLIFGSIFYATPPSNLLALPVLLKMDFQNNLYHLPLPARLAHHSQTRCSATTRKGEKTTTNYIQATP